MAAFDRIKSGIPEMDEALDNIRLGDNVVWRVSELSQFRLSVHFSPEKLEASKNIVGDIESGEALRDIVHVYDVSDRNCEVFNDIANEHLLITC